MKTIEDNRENEDHWIFNFKVNKIKAVVVLYQFLLWVSSIICEAARTVFTWEQSKH